MGQERSDPGDAKGPAGEDDPALVAGRLGDRDAASEDELLEELVESECAMLHEEPGVLGGEGNGLPTAARRGGKQGAVGGAVGGSARIILSVDEDDAGILAPGQWYHLGEDS